MYNHIMSESKDVCDSCNHRLKKSGDDVDAEEADEKIHFFPPLYIQRYSFALTLLMESNIKSVIDFGCSECGFMHLLPTVPSLERIALVDIDHELLVTKQRMIRPELRHHVFRRLKPLHVELLAGNAEETDTRMLDYEAVTLIEVIEHLYPTVLKNVVHNVFGNIQPKLCIVTTPNSEFNVLFGNEDPKQFRHWDHKFEWTRQEFHQWCDTICEVFGYRVDHSGVGYLLDRPDSDQFGPCSQAAIFTLIGERDSAKSLQQSSLCYEMIAESDFPYEKEILSLEEKIDLEVAYCLRQMIRFQEDEQSLDQPVQISVSKLAELYTVRTLCDESGVRESLERLSYRFSENGLYIILDNIDEAKDDLCDDIDRLDVASDCLLNVDQMTPKDDTSGILQNNSGVVEEDWDIDDS